MANPTPEQQQEQYAAIELLYSEGKWGEVLQASEALLAALPAVQGHPLRPRLELVIGHTLLYGLADLDGAEQRYRTVLLDTEEPVLREIAEQGLGRCSEQRQQVAVGAAAQPAPVVEPPTETRPPSDVVADVSVEASDEAAGGGPDAAPIAAEMATAMPWDLNPGASVGGRREGAATAGAAMPWLAELSPELGVEPPATTEPTGHSEPEPDVSSPSPLFADSVRTARNVESPDSGQTSPDPGPTSSTAPQDATPPATADETLALLREPDELIPVTVQVLEEAQAPAEVESQPEAPKEEPPLSPDEMAELARGLLEVVLR
jgi:hypothetical protein